MSGLDGQATGFGLRQTAAVLPPPAASHRPPAGRHRSIFTLVAGGWRLEAGGQIDRRRLLRYTSHPMGPLANFWAIVSVPDNIPIVFMLLLVGYFTYLSFDEARKNDRLIREGRKDQILRRMQD
jgi:hypothetical protein